MVLGAHIDVLATSWIKPILILLRHMQTASTTLPFGTDQGHSARLDVCVAGRVQKNITWDTLGFGLEHVASVCPYLDSDRILQTLHPRQKHAPAADQLRHASALKCIMTQSLLYQHVHGKAR